MTKEQLLGEMKSQLDEVLQAKRTTLENQSAISDAAFYERRVAEEAQIDLLNKLIELGDQGEQE